MIDSAELSDEMLQKYNPSGWIAELNNTAKAVSDEVFYKTSETTVYRAPQAKEGDAEE